MSGSLDIGRETMLRLQILVATKLGRDAPAENGEPSAGRVGPPALGQSRANHLVVVHPHSRNLYEPRKTRYQRWFPACPWSTTSMLGAARRYVTINIRFCCDGSRFPRRIVLLRRLGPASSGQGQV